MSSNQNNRISNFKLLSGWFNNPEERAFEAQTTNQKIIVLFFTFSEC